MLAIFEKSVARCPEELRSPDAAAKSPFAMKDGFLANHFGSVHPCSGTIDLGSSALLAYSSDKQNPLLPRLFAGVDDLFCLFQGHIENFPFLKQQYGLNKPANEAIIVIEAYRALRDRRLLPAVQVLRDFKGKFAFILFDSSNKTVFVAADADGSVPFFWGTDAEGHLVLSDNSEIVKKGCGNSYAPFPKGCFFTSSGGLRSFIHPMNELKAVPREDSSGQICGAMFEVDKQVKKENPGMRRVGSVDDLPDYI